MLTLYCVTFTVVFIRSGLQVFLYRTIILFTLFVWHCQPCKHICLHNCTLYFSWKLGQFNNCGGCSMGILWYIRLIKGFGLENKTTEMSVFFVFFCVADCSGVGHPAVALFPCWIQVRETPKDLMCPHFNVNEEILHPKSTLLIDW